VEQHFSLDQRFWEMLWPWSIVCDWGLLLVANLLFIWAGIALYSVSRSWAVKEVGLSSLLRAIAASIPSLIALWAALITLPKLFFQVNIVPQHGPTVDPTTNLRLAAIAVRVPFFFVVLSTLWRAAPRPRHRIRPAGHAG
jgi:hypothetical protein